MSDRTKEHNLAREFRQFFHREEFYICCSLCAFLAVGGFLYEFPRLPIVFSSDSFSAAHKAMVFQGGIGQAYVVCLLPLLCTFSYSDSYYTERTSGYFLAVRSRLGRQRYLRDKAIVLLVTSFFIAILPYVLNQLLCFVAYPLDGLGAFGSHAYGSSLYDEIGNAHFPLLHMNAPYLNNLVHMSLTGLYGSLLGLLSFSLSLHFRYNRILTLTATTLILFSWYIVCSVLPWKSFIPYFYLFANPVVGDTDVVDFFAILAVLLVANFSLLGTSLKRDEL